MTRPLSERRRQLFHVDEQVLAKVLSVNPGLEQRCVADAAQGQPRRGDTPALADAVDFFFNKQAQELDAELAAIRREHDALVRREAEAKLRVRQQLSAFLKVMIDSGTNPTPALGRHRALLEQVQWSDHELR